MDSREFILPYLLITVLLYSFGCASGDKMESVEDEAQLQQELLNDTEVRSRAFRYDTNPASVFQTVDTPEPITENLRHESVIGYTYVDFSNLFRRLNEISPGDNINLHLPDNLIIEAEITRMRSVSNLVTISARMHEPHRGFVSLTVEDDRVIGTIELYSENRIFHIRYDRLNDMIYLAEIDPSKLDIQPGSPPITPPINGDHTD